MVMIKRPSSMFHVLSAVTMIRSMIRGNEIMELSFVTMPLK